MSQNTPLLSLTVLAAAAIVAERFVTLGGVTATAAGNSLGVSRSSAASGERFAADVIGTAIVTAGEAIAVDDEIEVGATGKAAVLGAGVKVARALEAASGDGERLEVLLIQN